MRKKVMVFGVFDGLHNGHRAFLKEAKSYGDYLIVVLPPDHLVKELKGRPPKSPIAQRFEHLRKADHVDAVIVGDAQLDSWQVLENHRPQVIALGYDQQKIKDDLARYFKDKDWQPEIKVIGYYQK
jgi:cytidyltransferase-like protein